MSTAAQLRTSLERLTGRARARPLLELAQALTDEYWRMGPGKPDALPLLDGAITAIDEAYPFFGPDDGVRPQVAAMRGWLHGIRCTVHFGPEPDRTIGIEQLEEALRSPALPPVMIMVGRLTLAQLYMKKATEILQTPNFASMVMSGGVPADAIADLDRAIAGLEQVSAESTVREGQEAARILLRIAGAMRTIVGSAGAGSGAAAMSRIMEAMSVLQEMHREQADLAAVGPVGAIRFVDADEMASRPPLDRPVPLIEVDDPDVGRPAARMRPAPAADATDPAALRRELRARISAGGDLFDALDARLDPGAPAPPVALVDDVVALATEVIDAGVPNRTDHLLLAVGLCLRAGAAGARWVRHELDEATAGLLHAADSPRPAPPEAVRVMRRVATMLDRIDPACRARERLSTVLRRP